MRQGRTVCSRMAESGVADEGPLTVYVLLVTAADMKTRHGSEQHLLMSATQERSS